MLSSKTPNSFGNTGIQTREEMSGRPLDGIQMILLKQWRETCRCGGFGVFNVQNQARDGGDGQDGQCVGLVCRADACLPLQVCESQNFNVLNQALRIVLFLHCLQGLHQRAVPLPELETCAVGGQSPRSPSSSVSPWIGAL